MYKNTGIHSGVAIINDKDYAVEAWEESAGGLRLAKRYFRVLDSDAEIGSTGKVDMLMDTSTTKYREILDLYKFKYERVTGNIFVIYYSFDNLNKVVVQ